jgi:hypothetical protein
LDNEISQTKEIALGAEKAITYKDYAEMVSTLNSLP